MSWEQIHSYPILLGVEKCRLPWKDSGSVNLIKVLTADFRLPVSLLEAVVYNCSVKKVFLEVLQNSQEKTCARISFLIKLKPWGLQIY